MKGRGHSITEYALIGFLIVLVAIPALGSIGVSIDGLFSDNSQSISQADGLFSLLSGNGGVGEGGMGSPDGSTASAMAGGSGDQSATQIPATDDRALSNMSMGLVSTSVNGRDELVSAVSDAGASSVAANRLMEFNQAIDSRLADGKITAEQAGVLRELSNQGYRIAKIEKIIEDAKSFHEPVTFEGQTYANLHEFSKLIGFQGKSPVDVLSADLMEPGDSSAGTALRKFQEAYQQVSRNITDPELGGMVESLSTEIIVLTEMVEDAAWNKGQNPGIDVKKFSASRITDMDSDAFCAAGNGNGTGAICN